MFSLLKPRYGTYMKPMLQGFISFSANVSLFRKTRDDVRYENESRGIV